MDRQRPLVLYCNCINYNRGDVIVRERYRNIDGVTKKVTTTTRIPNIAEKYFSYASKVDEFNRCHQDGLSLEKKIGTKD